MNGCSAILVSPHPVDGYPPVQHQAQLLADAGYQVVLITVALAWSKEGVHFTHPGVKIREVAKFPAGAMGAARRTAAFVAAVLGTRRRASNLAVEIAYEPSGLFYSDIAPLRPARRIAHFHECLQAFETARLEKRVKTSIKGYQLIVVPDAERAQILQHQLGLTALPTTVPNYPIAERERPCPSRPKDERFEVVYCGSLGTQQKLDLVAKSVRLWPDQARFHIVGNNTSVTAKEIDKAAQEAGVSERVVFDGWMAYEAVPSRLASADLGISLLDPSYEQWRTALGASNKRYQYMQAGLPQIGDMNPGVPELLEGQGIGRCIRANSEEAIAAVVQEYVADPERCRREGDRAYALYRERYNYPVAFEPVLAWVSNSAGRPAQHVHASGLRAEQRG